MTLDQKFEEWMNVVFQDELYKDLQVHIRSSFSLLEPFHKFDIETLDKQRIQIYMEKQMLISAWYKDSVRLIVDCLYTDISAFQNIQRQDRKPKAKYRKDAIDLPPTNHLSQDASVSEVYALTNELYIKHQSKRKITNYNQMRRIVEPYARKPFRLMRPHHLSGLLIEYGPSAYPTLLNLFKKMEQYAYAYDIVDTLFFNNCTAAKNQETRVYHEITREDKESLLLHQGIFHVDLTLFFLYTGLTPIEMEQFNRDWIDLTNNEITTKHTGLLKRNRIIPIHEKLCPIMKRWSELADEDFFKTINGLHFRTFDFAQMMRLASLSCCHRFITPGDCRYHFQCQLEQTDATTTQIAVLLGNTPLGTGASIYTHPSPTTLHAIIDKLS